MARAGIEKSDVNRARTTLLAQGVYPSIDAVRAELGNTGSKSTIHRYLKELEEEAGRPPGQELEVGDAIQELVTQLAVALQATADDRITAANLTHQASTVQWKEEIEAHRRTAQELRLQLGQSQSALADQTSRHEDTRAKLQAESKENARLTQQVHDLHARLEVEAAHRLSLEDKHEHARLALEHFRQAAKEQREQEQLRHAEQIQQLQAEMRLARQTLIVKQDELTRLHQDTARQASELLQLGRLYDQQLEQARETARQTTQQREALQAQERREAELAATLAQREALLASLEQRLAEGVAHGAAVEGRLREQELELARSQARQEEQRRQLDDWRTHLDRLVPAAATPADSLPTEAGATGGQPTTIATSSPTRTPRP